MRERIVGEIVDAKGFVEAVAVVGRIGLIVRSQRDMIDTTVECFGTPLSSLRNEVRVKTSFVMFGLHLKLSG